MAHEQKRLRRGVLKRNLAPLDESNRAKIMGGIGQPQEQVSPIVSEKALEQPLVKPGGLRRTVGRVGRAIRNVGLQPSEIATNLLTKRTGGGDRIVSPAITAGEVATATRKRKAEIQPRQIGTSVLTEEGGVSTLRGTKPPSTKQIDFTRGSAIEVAVAKRAQKRALAKTGRGRGVRRGRARPFDITSFRGIENIFSTAGELAAGFARPEFQDQLAKARGAGVRRKGKRADVKLVNERIKALSSTLQNLSLEKGNDEIRSKIETQIADLITKGSVGTSDVVLNRAVKLKKAGFNDEEITRYETALGA